MVILPSKVKKMRGDITVGILILGAMVVLMVSQAFVILRMTSSPGERINLIADMLSLDNVLSPQQALSIYLNYHDNDRVLRIIVAGTAFAAARRNPVALAILAYDVQNIEKVYSKKFLRKIEALKIGTGPAEIPSTDLEMLRSYCQMWKSGSIGGITSGSSYDKDLYYNTFLGDVPLSVSPVTISQLLYRNRAALEKFVTPDSDVMGCGECWPYYENLRNGADPETAYTQATNAGCADKCKNFCISYLAWLSDLDKARMTLQYNYGQMKSCIECYTAASAFIDCESQCKLYKVLNMNPFSG